MVLAAVRRMKVAVIVNAGAGSIGSAECDARIAELERVFADAGVEVEVVRCEPTRLTEMAGRLAVSGVDAVVAAGGDGTVSSVAAGLVGRDVPLAVMPLGTLNHFARDIGMPNDLAEAARVIAAGRCAQLDVGTVNGRVFINNSSIGLYPEMVMFRDVERKQTGRGKWSAMLLAAMRVLRRFPLLAVRVTTPRRRMRIRTPFVFVGNNDYSTGVRSLGQRPSLDGHQLSIYTVRCSGRLQLFWILARALAGRVAAVPDLEQELVTEAWVSLHHRRLTVALDGEITRMSSPLHYRIHPGGLRVIVGPSKEVAEPVELPLASPMPRARVESRP